MSLTIQERLVAISPRLIDACDLNVHLWMLTIIMLMTSLEPIPRRLFNAFSCVFAHFCFHLLLLLGCNSIPLSLFNGGVLLASASLAHGLLIVITVLELEEVRYMLVDSIAFWNVLNVYWFYISVVMPYIALLSCAK